MKERFAEHNITCHTVFLHKRAPSLSNALFSARLNGGTLSALKSTTYNISGHFGLAVQWYKILHKIGRVPPENEIKLDLPQTGPRHEVTFIHSFIHSFILAISIVPLQVLYYSEALPITGRILYRSFTPKRTGNCR